MQSHMLIGNINKKMFSKNGSTNKEPSQLSTVSVDHFFECVKKEKVEDGYGEDLWDSERTTQ